ncbi:MAG: hypothetical protein J6N45_08955 [Alphaproteobacteria bacterium]|nr:hypothetical protein [Alphaproteobacteria bacterium]
MAYTKITEIKSADDANEIIYNGFAYTRVEVDTALQYLSNHGIAWPTIVKADSDGYADTDGARRKAAEMYERTQASLGKPIDEQMKQQADDFVRDFDAYERSVVNSYEEENVVDGDPISAYDSYNELLARLDGYEDEHNPNGTWRQIVADIDESIIFGSEKEPNLVLQDTLWETVKTNILRNRTLNKDWQDAMRNGTAHEFLKEEIYSAYMAEAEIQAKALEVREPEGMEKEIGSQEHANYLAGIYQKAKEIFADLGKKGKKLKITENSAVVGASVAYAKFNEFAEYLRVKRDTLGKRIYGSKIVQAATAYADRLDKNMEQKHPKLWGKFKNFALGVRASKYQIKHYAIGSAVVGGASLAATAGIVGAGVATTAMGLYAAYTAVGAWVYPIVQRKQMELIKARAAGDKNMRQWEGWQGFKKAFNTTLFKEGETDEEGYAKINWRSAGGYFVKGTIGSMASLVVMDMATNWLGGGKVWSDAVTNSSIGHWLQGMIKTPEAVRTQALATFNRSIVRTVGAIVPSVATVAGDTTTLAANIVTWNKEGIKRSWQNLQGSLTGLALVGAISGVSLEAQAAFMNHQYANPDVPADAAQTQESNVLYQDKNGYTMVEDGDKVVLKHGDEVVKEYNKDESWNNATAEQKAAFAQQEATNAKVAADNAATEEAAAQAAAQAAADEKALLEQFKDFLAVDENGNVHIPTTATEANMTDREWQVFNQRLSGIIGTEEGAAHIGVAQVDPDAVREEALMNLMKYMSENPDAFPAGSNPLKVLNNGLEAHYYSVTHGYFDGDGHWIAEKYKWIEMDGKEVEVMGRYAKVGDGDTYGRVTGDYLRLNGQKLKIEDGFVTIKGEKVAVETGYAKVGDEIVQFNPATDAKITVDGTEYNVGSKWLHGDSSNEKNLNAFMDIICKGNTDSEDLSMANSIQTLNAAADHSWKTGEGNRAVGIGRNCDEVTVFKFAKKHIPVHHNTPAPAPEVETRTIVTDTAVAKEVETRTVVTDTAVEKTAPEPKETKTYIVFNREAVNPKSLDQYEAPGHQKLNSATVIRVKTRE